MMPQLKLPPRKPLTHTVPSAYVRPDHPIQITVIGCGGTGSHMLTRLAMVNYALLKLNHPGIVVVAYDPDHFTEYNVGRQNCYPSDVGLNKADVLISRINRTYGFKWHAHTTSWDGKTGKIVITCVDNVKTRQKVRQNDKYDYWLDIGNDQNVGQVILGTGHRILQPAGSDHNCVSRLPNVFDLFPDLRSFDRPEDPSCSMAEALGRQDLCVNSMMATWAQRILWMMLHEYRLEYHGVFVNLKTLSTTPVKITIPKKSKRGT